MTWSLWNLITKTHFIQAVKKRQHIRHTADFYNVMIYLIKKLKKFLSALLSSLFHKKNSNSHRNPAQIALGTIRHWIRAEFSLNCLFWRSHCVFFLLVPQITKVCCSCLKHFIFKRDFDVNGYITSDTSELKINCVI